MTVTEQVIKQIKSNPLRLQVINAASKMDFHLFCEKCKDLRLSLDTGKIVYPTRRPKQIGTKKFAQILSIQQTSYRGIEEHKEGTPFTTIAAAVNSLKQLDRRMMELLAEEKAEAEEKKQIKLKALKAKIEA